ncbi:MAG TPA: hypothetical protein VFT93_00480, partial [Candidatus Eisenbacteria bacterium]|nr:hypothetical protein [Candidatus Eisenbacteria bacterium]
HIVSVGEAGSGHVAGREETNGVSVAILLIQVGVDPEAKRCGFAGVAAHGELEGARGAEVGTELEGPPRRAELGVR